MALGAAACGSPAIGARSPSTPAVAPSQAPAAAALVQLAIPPPARLSIPALGVDAAVESVGVTTSGAMDTPRLFEDVGWYARGRTPGSTGDAVIDGHAGLPGSPLVFAHLAALVPGDAIIVTATDGTRRRFLVTGAASWPADSKPAGLFRTDGPATLSLITCDGQYEPATRKYADRLIVDAAYVGLD